MKLLVITQKVDQNDDVLGFAHEWIRGLSHEFSEVRVICLAQGQSGWKEQNIHVHSLGKERGGSRIVYIFRLLYYVHTQRHVYDAVLVHMNPEYIVVAGWLWKLYKKYIVLWYAHGTVNTKLRVAAWFADLVLTSTPSGFRIAHPRIRVIGQGIDTSLFTPSYTATTHATQGIFRFIYVGRISPIKNVSLLIEATHLLNKKGRHCALDIIGSAATSSDVKYLHRVRQQIDALKLTDAVRMYGSVPNRLLPPYLNAAQCFINAGATGSLDKTMVEAMASGLPVITSNQSFSEIVGGSFGSYMFSPGNLTECTAAMIRVMDMDSNERNKVGEALRAIAVRDHSIDQFVRKIRLQLEQLENA
ncbi:MAG: glycosyltransferase family 4 protein [Patescibacteria group bacterium]